MATGQMSEVVRHLRGAVLPRDGAGLTDGQLLEGFTSRRDEAALGALVRRHGPMVWGVCRRVLRNHHDAEDAFQATFLVLARRAATIVPGDMVANWLYGVARQTALKARATAARRKRRERQVVTMPEPALAEPELCPDLRPLLDEELGRLPDKYRAVIALCDLGGETRKEAARRLGVPEGTVAGWLARARDLLAERLTRRGVALSGGVLAAVLARDAAAAPPATLVASTIKAATVYAAGQAGAVAVPANVAALAEGVLRSLAITRLKLVSVVLVLVAAMGGGTAVLTNRTPAAGPGESRQTALRAGRPADRKPTDRERLQGAWVATSQAIGGIPVADPALAEVRFVFVGDRVRYRGKRGTSEGTFRLDPARSPGVLVVRFDGEPADTEMTYDLTDAGLTLSWTKRGPWPGGIDPEALGTIRTVFEKR